MKHASVRTGLARVLPLPDTDEPAQPWRIRFAALLAFAVLLVALISASTMRGTGDAGEYLIQADKLAHFHAPRVSPSEYAKYNEWFSHIGGYLSITVALDGSNGPFEFNHFWFYGLIVAPVLRVTEFFQFSPVRAFTAVNCGFLLGAFWIVSRRLHWLPTMLVFAGPIVWWADKPHTEAFTFSLLAIAFALFRARPGAAAIALGLAATQNFPIGVAAAGVVLYGVSQTPARLKSLRFWGAVIVAGVLSVLNPLYFYWRLGTISPQSINGGLEPRFPSWQEFIAPVLDLNIGVVVGAPIIVVGFVAATVYVVRHWKRFDIAAMVLTFAVIIFFLFSFGQTGNFNHGATPSMSRYGLWLLPISVAVLYEAQRLGAGERLFGRRTTSAPFVVTTYVVLSLSVVLSIASFSPRIDDGLHKPTPVASWVWSNHPSWNNPLAEVFFERLQTNEGGVTPVATANCAKALVVKGVWPTNCGDSVPVPAKCQTAEVSVCYANRTKHGYAFVPQHHVPGFDANSVKVEDSDARLHSKEQTTP